MKTADNIKAFLRVRLPRFAERVFAVDEEGKEVAVSMEWDDTTRTLLVSYDSHAKAVNVTATWKNCI